MRADVVDRRVAEADPPRTGTSPCVGFSPTTPHSAAGMRTEPPASVPSAAGAMPGGHRRRRAAGGAAGHAAGSHGLRVGP